MIEDVFEGRWDKVRERFEKGVPLSLLGYLQRKFNEGVRQSIMEIRNKGKKLRTGEGGRK